MDPQQKTAAPAVAGYIPEYSETPHSGSFDIAQHGLSSDDVARLTAEGRVNTQNNKSSRTLWSIMRAHLFTVFNFVLGACGAVVIMYQRWADLLFLAAVIANVVIGFVQEYKAKLELDRISLLDRSPATAVRDGKSLEVPMEQLVEGDVVILKRGDQVPADAVVLTSDSLELDESLLTGENDPIAKRPGDMVLSASSVLGGTGRVLLSHVGANSRASKISDEARQFSRIQSELRDALNRVVRWITVGLAVIIPVVSWGQIQAAGGLETVQQNHLWEQVSIAVVSSVASMIPQGLALMTTLAFAAAAVALGRKHNILVQEQPAVEVLARVDVVCFDKTGTLTEGGVIFDSVRPLDTVAEAEGPDADSAEHTSWRASLPAGWNEALAWFGHDENANPTAAALTGGFPDASSASVSGIVPFSSALRFSAIEFKDSGAWLLGAPEALLAKGTAERERAAELAALGLRTMVLAHASAVVRNEKDEPIQKIPSDATPVLFVIFRENVRADALEHLPEVHASVIYIFQTIEGYRASAFLLIMQGIVVILPAGETFTVALDNVQVARDVAHVILDDEVAVAAFYHKSSGANTHTIVTNGSELNHCTYLNVVRDKLFTVAVDKLIAPFIGEGDGLRGFDSLISHWFAPFGRLYCMV